MLATQPDGQSLMSAGWRFPRLFAQGTQLKVLAGTRRFARLLLTRKLTETVQSTATGKRERLERAAWDAGSCGELGKHTALRWGLDALAQAFGEVVTRLREPWIVGFPKFSHFW